MDTNSYVERSMLIVKTKNTEFFLKYKNDKSKFVNRCILCRRYEIVCRPRKEPPRLNFQNITAKSAELRYLE